MIDYAEGIIRNGSDKEFYMELLDMFLEQCEDAKSTLKKDLETENWKEYQITVHSLKGSALQLEAGSFGRLADQHNLAAKAGDMTFIKNDASHLMEELDKMIAELSNVLQNGFINI